MNAPHTTPNCNAIEVLINYDKILPLMKMKESGDCVILYIEHCKRKQSGESLDNFQMQTALGWGHKRFSNAICDLVCMGLVTIVRRDPQ